MTIIQKTIPVAVALLALVFPFVTPAFAFAASLDGGAALGVSTDINLHSEDGSTSGDSDSAQVSGTSSVDVDANSFISVGRDDVNTIDDASTSGNTGFSAYAHTVIQNDVHVENISSHNDEVSLSYDEPVRLFGVFPMLVAVTATVNGRGDLQLQYPWYHIVMATDRAQLESSLQNRLNSELGMTADGSTTASLDASTKARIVSAMHDVMKAHLDADMSASTDTQANSN